MHSLHEKLKGLLPKSEKPFQLLNIHSTPRESKNVICTPAEQKQWKPTTIKTQHLICLFHDRVPIIAIEIYVYINVREEDTERLVFVSKADTTGLFTEKKHLKVGLIIETFLNWLLRIPIHYYTSHVLQKRSPQDVTFTNSLRTSQILRLLTEKQSNRPVRSYKSYACKGTIVTTLSMFTRPEPQYLFPYSQENPGKHALDGESLLRWWCRIVDKVVTDSLLETTELYLTIPGADRSTIERYLKPLYNNWQPGTLFTREQHSSLAVYSIPLFPDDPKGRFLEDLVLQNRIKKVSTDQFWLELSVRQEFGLGIVAGVIGVTGVAKVDDAQDLEAVSVDNLLSFSKRKFVRIKNYVTDNDYSQEDECTRGYTDINNVFGVHVFSEIHGERDIFESEEPKSAPVNLLTSEEKKIQPVVINNLNVKRKKKTQ